MKCHFFKHRHAPNNTDYVIISLTNKGVSASVRKRLQQYSANISIHYVYEKLISVINPV